jgi:hypothetical protein
MSIRKSTKLKIRHDECIYIYIYIYISAKYSFAWNAVFHNINCCVINQNSQCMQWLTLCATTGPLISVQQIVYSYCGLSWRAPIRHGTLWGFRYLRWRMFSNYRFVECDIVQFSGTAEQCLKLNCILKFQLFRKFLDLIYNTERLKLATEPQNATICCKIKFYLV